MDSINEIARSRGIEVIEDAAQAHGAEYQGRRAGLLGEMACFSFYPTKNLGAYGEAGAVVTANPEYAAAIRPLRNWSQTRRARTGVIVPVARAHVRHVYHAYTIRTPERGGLVEGLTTAGIQTGVHYPLPVHLQPAYRDARYSAGGLPVAERAAKEVVSLPIYPELQPV